MVWAKCQQNFELNTINYKHAHTLDASYVVSYLPCKKIVTSFGEFFSPKLFTIVAIIKMIQFFQPFFLKAEKTESFLLLPQILRKTSIALKTHIESDYFP